MNSHYWVNIDLHTHTHVGVTRDGGADVVSFTYKAFQKAVFNHSLELMACTNHNKVFFGQYVALRYLAKLCNCHFLLGVELDTTSPNLKTPLHVAMILDSTDAKSDFVFSQTINGKTDEKKATISRGKAKELVYSSEEIVGFLEANKAIIVPHGDKDRGLLNRPSPEQIRECLQLVRERFIHVLDGRPSKWKLAQVRSCLDSVCDDVAKEVKDSFGGVLFSDCRDWGRYDDVYQDFAMDAEPTFGGFLHAITNPINRFALRDDATDPTNYISSAVITSTDGTKMFLPFSPRFNCIIGKSGSGKSLFLYLLKKALGFVGGSTAEYKDYNYSVELLGPNGNLLKPNDIQVVAGIPVYQKIIEAISSNDDANRLSLIGKLSSGDALFEPKKALKAAMEVFRMTLREYWKIKKDVFFKKKQVETDLASFKASAAFLSTNSDTLELTVLGDEKELPSAASSLNHKELSELIRKITEQLRGYNGRAKEALRSAYQAFLKAIELAEADDNAASKTYLLRKTIRDLIRKAIIAVNGKTNDKSRKLSEERQNAASARKTIASGLCNGYLDRCKIEALDLRLDLPSFRNCRTTIAPGVEVAESLVDEKEVTAYDQRSQNGIIKIRGYSGSIPSELRDLTSKKDVIRMLEDYERAGLFGGFQQSLVFTDSDYPKIRTDLFFDGQNVSELNPGDIAKKYIGLYFGQQVLGKRNSIVIFDQIENDVDKPFLKDDIVSHIESCYKQSQIFIVTHDPIIAVNADPRRYILAEKDKRKKITYRSFSPESEERDELTTIAECVDGSKEVIRRRFEIYEKENQK